MEDETYVWKVTRYVHLNPVRAGTVEHPAAWAWSSYPGSGASGIGLPGAESDDGDQHGASGTARAFASGECAEPDATFRRLASDRCETSKAVEKPGGGVGPI